ncbi:MAG: SIR2 family protein [Pyrinomonadaceae bacterium]
MEILELKDAKDKIEFLRNSSPVVFVGSGVSIWKPTGLANGISVTDSLRSIIFEDFDQSDEEKYLLESLTKWFPFEHLFELAPNKQKANDLLTELYDCSISNPVHKTVSKAFSNGKISHIITTNYDKCFEDALKAFPSLKFRTIINEEQSLEALSDTASKFYFKIHGTAEKTNKNLTFTLRDEGLLPKGKRGLLKQLLANRVCLFIGYSGFDFDICPLIARIPNVRIIWTDIHGKPQSTNANALLRQTNGTYIKANMLEFLPAWLKFDIGINPNERPVLRNITPEEIKGIFSEEEISLWRMAILNAVGLPKLAKRATSDAKGKVSEKERLWHEARALFNEGKYLTAAEMLGFISMEYSKDGNFKLAADTWLDTSDSYRAGGYFIRAWQSLLKSRIASRKYDKAKYFLKKCMLILNISDGLKSIKPLHILIKIWLKRNLKLCAEFSLEQGSLLDFQQAGLIASRSNISLKELEKGDYFAPPEPKEGYRHIGYYLAEVMTFFDEYSNADFDALSEEQKKEILQKFKEHIKNCELTEQFPNLWKLLAVYKNFLEKTGLEVFRDNDKLNTYFQSCEYSNLMKTQQAKKFGIAGKSS